MHGINKVQVKKQKPFKYAKGCLFLRGFQSEVDLAPEPEFSEGTIHPFCPGNLLGSLEGSGEYCCQERFYLGPVTSIIRSQMSRLLRDG